MKRFYKIYIFWIFLLTITGGFLNSIGILYFGEAISHYSGNLSKIAIEYQLHHYEHTLKILGLFISFFMGWRRGRSSRCSSSAFTNRCAASSPRTMRSARRSPISSGSADAAQRPLQHQLHLFRAGAEGDPAAAPHPAELPRTECARLAH